MATYAKEKGFTVQTLSTDPVASQVAGGSWASGGNMNTAREEGGGAGTQTAGLVFGGSTGSDSALNESYNGSSWTELADLNDARKNASGFGTQTAALLAGGNPNSANTETWAGRSWTEVNNLNTGRENILNAGAGVTTAGLVWGGYDDPAGTGRAIVESWNGSSWTEVNDLNSERYDCSGNGTSTAALAVSGTDGGAPISSVESWNGSAWTEVAEANTPRGGTSSTGTYTSLILVGGATSTATVANTEYYDGTSWTEVSDISTATRDQMPSKAGTSSLAFVAGGSQPTRVATTEEWTAPSTFTKQIEGQLFFNSTSNAFKVTEKSVPGGVWATGGSLNTARAYIGPATRGTQDAALGFGGDPNGSTVTESYNGSSWTEVNDLNTSRAAAAGAGTYTSALASTGFPSTGKDKVESWDGSSWTEVAEPNLPRDSTGGTGASNTSAIIFGGYNPPQIYEAETEVWDGTSWTEVSDLNTARRAGGSAGIATSAMFVGGGIQTDSTLDNVETWNGTSWTEVAEINVGNSQAGCGSDGTNTNVLRFGGEKAGSPNANATTELWNGTSWTELNDLATARYTPGGAGSTSSAIAFGGYADGSDVGNTEEWTAPLANFTITSS